MFPLYFEYLGWAIIGASLSLYIIISATFFFLFKKRWEVFPATAILFAVAHWCMGFGSIISWLYIIFGAGILLWGVMYNHFKKFRQ